MAECLRIARTRLERPALTRQDPTLRLPAYALHVVLHPGTIAMQGSFQELVNSRLIKTIYSGSTHASKEAL